MNHYISVCTLPGVHSDTAIRVPLEDVVSHFGDMDMARMRKEDNRLIYEGYVDVPTEYPREETEDGIMKMNTMIIDCDNRQKDPLLLDKFKEDMKRYRYIVYETSSSTSKIPKFRALIPLDSTLTYDKYAKKAVFKIFSDYADSNATWHLSPDRRHLHTVDIHEGELFRGEIVQNWADDLKKTSERDELRMKLRSRCFNAAGLARTEDGWRNLPSVKHCLEGLVKGERDTSLCKACYAMDKHGYRDRIQDFLEEVSVPNEFKDKYRRRYR